MLIYGILGQVKANITLQNIGLAFVENGANRVKESNNINSI